MPERVRIIFCAACGAPLDAPWLEITVVCRFCGVQNIPGQHVPPVMPDDGRPRVKLDGRTYVVEGRLAHGESSDVFRARWAIRLGELVVVKVQRALGDSDLLRREHTVLRQLLANETQGAAHFTGRLPQPIAFGPVHLDRERLVAVHDWKSGFVHTLLEVCLVHSRGVDCRIAVWVLKRLLELLGWVHKAGLVHGSVTPRHVLIHPRDHGATLVGWTLAGRPGEALPAAPAQWLDWYHLDRLEPALDVAMATRCALAMVGGLADPAAGLGPLPAPLPQVLRPALEGHETDAWALLERVSDASLTAFGPPRYNPLPMPGWPARS